MYEKIIFFSFIFNCFILFGCGTTMVSNKSERDRNYRNAQTELRNEQENITTTSSEIKSTSKQIGETVHDITATSQELENTVNATASKNNELGEILQRVRSREIPNNITLELRKKYPNLFFE